MHPTNREHLPLAKAIGRVPSGIFILTAKDQSQATAMLASWVQQAAFEPPSISVALAKGRPIAELIRSSQRFALSIVARDDTSLLKRYARGVRDGEDPFADVGLLPQPDTAPPVLVDALAYMQCRLLSVFEFGADHELFIGEVVAGDVLRDGMAFSHQRGNGFHY